MLARWRALACLRVSRHWLAAGEYEPAARWARRSVRAAGRRHRSAPTTVDALTVLAGAAKELGDHAGAETVAEQALRLLATGRGQPAQLVAVLVDLADTNRLRGRYHAAEQVLTRAAAAAVTIADPLVLARVHNSLGVVCKDTARYGEAGRWYRQALTVAGNRGMDGQPLAATLWHNLAGLAHARGRYRDAEDAARRAIELRGRRFGAGHPEVARDLTVLAASLAGQGRLDEAEARYRDALTIVHRHLGTDHYEVAVVLNGLGGLARQRRRPRAAERMQRDALSIKLRVLGAQHPEVAVVMNNLAVSLHKTGQHLEADRMWRDALAILDQTLGPEHPTTVTCRENLTRGDVTRGTDHKVRTRSVNLCGTSGHP